MKNIKIYIVTYKRSEVLNKTLESIFSSDLPKYEKTSVTIINNHTDFNLQDEFKDRVKVLHNMTRPDWSCGNLSENYNQAFIHGFKNLDKPDCDILVTLQNDAIVPKDFISKVLEMHRHYDFVIGPYGDNYTSHTATSVKKIGMWDENFCGGQYKEADYAIRSMIEYPERSCVHDELCNLYFNDSNFLHVTLTEGMNYEKGSLSKGHYADIKRLPDDQVHLSIKQKQTQFRNLYKNYFYHKWDGTWKQPPNAVGWIHSWPKDFTENPPSRPKIKTYMKYPYFEFAIENLKQKGYVL